MHRSDIIRDLTTSHYTSVSWGEGHGCWGCYWKGFILSVQSFRSAVKIQSKAFLKDPMHNYRDILQNCSVVVTCLNSQRVVVTISVCVLFL